MLYDKALCEPETGCSGVRCSRALSSKGDVTVSGSYLESLDQYLLTFDIKTAKVLCDSVCDLY